MKQLFDYENYDAIGLATLVKQKEITPLELLHTVIARAEKFNPLINAIVTKMYDIAEQTAAKVDLNAPFAGVPFLLKDLGIMYKNVVTSQGSHYFNTFIPPIDSEIVTRFKRAGLVIFGKTNTPEFGLSYTTEPSLFGPCHNPWDLSLSPGGSSGGAAAAVAARVVPMAHATDGGGSIRVPAACCGLFGLKPTRARVPMGPIAGEGWSGMSTTHVISRSVRDSALCLDILAGPELGDPYYAPPQKQPFIAEVGTNPGKLRIAFSTLAPFNLPVAQECVNAVHRAVQLCTDWGHIVEECDLICDQQLLVDAFQVIVTSQTHFHLRMRQQNLGRPPTETEIEHINRQIAAIGAQHSASDYAEAIFKIQRESRIIAGFFNNYDILITPTVAQPTLKLGSLERDGQTVEEFFQQSFAYGPFTSIWNKTGQPAMSLPLYWTEDNLPVGVQFVSQFGDEASLFRLAAQLEQIAPWDNRKPKLINEINKNEIMSSF